MHLHQSAIKAPAICLGILLCMAASLYAQGQVKTKSYSIKLGYYGSGDATVKTDDTEFDYETESGIAIGFSYDKISERFLIPGFAVDMVQVKFPGESSMAFYFSGSLKGNLLNGRWAIRPGIGAGAGLGMPFDRYDIDVSLHVAVKVTNDIVYYFRDDVGMVLEAGFLYDIYGNAGDYEVSGGPFPFIRGGFCF